MLVSKINLWKWFKKICLLIYNKRLMKNEKNIKNNFFIFIKGMYSLYLVIKIKCVFILLVLLYLVFYMFMKLKIVLMFKRNVYWFFLCFNKEIIVLIYVIWWNK